MPYLTNFYGWEFDVGTEEQDGRWVGIVRILGDESAPEARIRCRSFQDTEAEAMNDAKALAEDWSDRLERSPRSPRLQAEQSRKPGGDDAETGFHYG